MSKATILAEIRDFLYMNQVKPSNFGQAAVGDRNLVSDIELGRKPRPSTERRIRNYMHRTAR